MRRALAALLSALALCGCSDTEERADVGGSDGYAVGYNTACQIRATIIEGDFKNNDYAAAYAQGMEEGIAACNRERQAQRDSSPND